MRTLNRINELSWKESKKYGVQSMEESREEMRKGEQRETLEFMKFRFWDPFNQKKKEKKKGKWRAVNFVLSLTDEG